MRNDFYTRAFRGEGYGGGNREKEPHRRKAPRPDAELSAEDARRARGAFSRIGLSLFIFTAVTYAAIALIYAVIYLFFRDKAQAITKSVYFTWIINALPMYAVAFPALFLTLRNMERTSRPKSKLGIDEFILLFFVSQGVMTVGSLVGVSINDAISSLLGREVNNGVAELVSNSPSWILLLVVVIVGPIVEELIFRKLIIDRLSVFGDLTAVIASSVAFGLFHGNFYQFFYAAGLGFILGFIYTKTRNALYPIVMHTIINFLGSVVAVPLSRMLTELQEMAEVITAGGEVDYSRLLLIGGLLFTYTLLEYGMAAAGIVILAKKLKAQTLYISSEAKIALPRKDSVKIAVVNLGAILFLTVSLIQFIVNVFWA